MSDETKTTANEVALDELSINPTEKHDDVVDPWNVESGSDTGVDYDKLIRKFTMWFIATAIGQHVGSGCGMFRV